MDGSPQAAPAPDYAWIIDDEVWAFIRKTKSFAQPGPLTLESRRAGYDAAARHFNAGRPQGIETEDFPIPGPNGPIGLRRYLPPTGEGAALTLYFHGGGFVVGDLESHDDVCAEICARTGHEVVSVDYRLAPEHQHPAHFDDAFAAWEWAAEREARGGDRPILLCGDSAGATLAAAVAHAARGGGRVPAGQVLIYPSLGGSGQSYRLHAEAPMLSTAERLFYQTQRDMSLIPQDDPRAYPLRDPNVSGLPTTVCISAQCDPLADDGKDYRDRILAAGGRAISLEEPGLVHGFLRARHMSKRAGEAFGRIVESLRALGQGERPGF